MVWIYVRCADDDVSESSLDDRVCARRSAACCRTRLESHVKRRDRRNGRTEIAQTFNFRMGVPCFAVMSFRHYPTINHQDSAHSGIGTRPAECLFCLVQRSAHKLFVPVCRHGPSSLTNALTPILNLYCPVS